VSRSCSPTFSLLLAALAATCAQGTLPARTPGDPTNPDAPESPSMLASDAPASSADTGCSERSSEEETTVYACPMHPGVTSTTPGTCPRCGMKLEPRARRDAP
jgi:hypothetical protein